MPNAATTPTVIDVDKARELIAAVLSEYAANTGPLSHRIEYGMRIHYDRVQRLHTRDAFQIIAGEPIPEGSPTLTTAFNEAATTAIAVHAVDAIGVGNLTLTPGLRFETLTSRFTDLAAEQETRAAAQAVLPGVGAYYGLTPALGVLAGAYRGFSPPAPGSGEAAKPEFSINYEVGGRVSAGQSRAELIGFFNDYSNLTDVCTFSNGCLGQTLDRQFDAGSANIYGLEAYATHTLQLGELAFPLNVAYTLTRAEFTSAFASDDPIYGQVEKGDELPYVPRHRFNASLGIEVARLQANVALDYVSAVREQAGSAPLSETLSTDRIATLDANVKYRVAEPLLLYLNVRNVTGDVALVSHRPFGARPGAPRWVQAGGKLEF